jgi:ribosome-associated protein
LTDNDNANNNTHNQRAGTTRHSGAAAERKDARRLAIEGARAADDKGARDVIILEVADVLVVADYFVITSGANDRQVKAIVEEIERRVADAELGKPLRAEGVNERKWVLLDYGDVVVHVFLQEIREYYQLERLWSDVPRVDWAPTTVRS